MAWVTGDGRRGSGIRNVSCCPQQFELIEAEVREMMNHSSIVAWYVSDEPDSGLLPDEDRVAVVAKVRDIIGPKVEMMAAAYLKNSGPCADWCDVDGFDTILDEAITLFDQIVNSKWFKQTSMILFLNKKDLFLDKISDKDGKKGKVVKDYLKVPDAMAQHAELLEGNDEAKLHEYFKNWFMSQKKNKKQTVYTHVTTATDTNNITVVFNAIVNMILEKNMKEAGLG